MSNYWFKSTLFEIEPGEDAEVNPRRYGRQLAKWLKSKLEGVGYSVEEIIPEDWGWCVMCQREPYWLWVGCGNMDDLEANADSPPPKKDDIIWHCFSTAEVFFWKRLFKKVDSAPALAKLDSHLREILSSERGIMLVDEP
jgi:hypothetical protein